MEKFIPFEKLSKRKKRELLARRRKTWEGLNPVTRKPENPKAYKRGEARRWGDDDDSPTDVPFSMARPSEPRTPSFQRA
jgi:hypothetical protein